MAYVFTTNLLSAEKTGNPQLIGTSLSGVGVTFLSDARVPFDTQSVVVVSLSSDDVGIAFSPVNVTVASQNLSTFSLTAYPVVSTTVDGCVFLIPPHLDGSSMAIVESQGNFTTFAWSSATGPSAITSRQRDVLTPNQRRLWLYGYI